MAPRYETDCASNGRDQYTKCDKSWVSLGRDPTTTNWLLVVVGALQVALLLVQLRVSRTQTEIQIAQHAATHKPRLRVRNFRIKHSDSTISCVGDQLLHKEPIEIHFTVENFGGSRATVDESYTCLFETAKPLGQRPYEGVKPQDNQPLTAGTVIPAGESRRAFCLWALGVTEDMARELSPQGLDRSSAQRWLYVMGYIAHRDGADVTRRKSFCRMYDRGRGRFTHLPVPDEDFETPD